METSPFTESEKGETSVRWDRYKSLWLCVIGITLSLGLRVGFARPTIRTSFFNVYPAAIGTTIETVPSHLNHCGQCHYDFSGGGPRNTYGIRLGEVLGNFGNNDAGRQQAIRFIENEDSDGDGFSSLIEITNTVTFSNTPTFSGLTPVNVDSVTNVNVSEIQGHLVPSTGGDTTPPSVIVVNPNGGQTHTANSSATVQWTASDASGVAAIEIYLSEDNGQNYRPIAMGLPNSGSHTWFPPNRPTTTARILVVAIDNAFNEGGDVSDGAFTIQSPTGGIVPTTLRDFDMPGTQPFDAGTINDPAGCAVCHGNYDPDVEPYFNWEGSMMAQASRDILFEACMAVANQDAPDSGDLCLRCHLPKGWLGGRSVPTDGSQMLVADEIGVSCDLCHRMVDPFYDPVANPAEDADILAELEQVPTNFGNGMYVIDPNGTRRGPFVNATSGHAVLVSPFHREAGFCGTCHDVSNTAFAKDANGNYVPNTFNQGAAGFSSHTLMPIERTYSEWFYSAYNTPQGVYSPQFGGNRDFVGSCQDCHMRDVTGQGCNFGNPPTRTDLPLHDMTGGSTWLPGLLSTMYPGQVNDTALQSGIQRARYMLQNAASLTVGQEGTRLNVTVTNGTGHKLPTGYPGGRRVWINVKFYDASLTLLAESAAYDPLTGVLTQDSDAKVYEAEPGLDSVTAPLVGVPVGPSFHFVLNNKIYKDNRIPPRGFNNATFSQFGGAPVGTSYADGQYWDVGTYDIPTGSVSVEVALYYQSTSREFVEFLRDENITNDRGQVLFDLWNNNEKCPPELMRTVSVPLTPPQACCLPNGACQNLIAADCVSAGGESFIGAACTAAQTCCLPDHLCINIDPVCCVVDAGLPGEVGSTCGATACPDCLVNSDCEDGFYCNGMETCNLETHACMSGIFPGCNDGIACTVDFCDPLANDGAGGCINAADDSYCGNSQFCDGTETCTPADPNAGTDGCLAGIAPHCDDGYACTLDSCDPSADLNQGACVGIRDNAFCSNGQFCDGAESCVPTDPNSDADGCVPGVDPCPNISCDEITNQCTGCVTDAECDDGQFCNGGETCNITNSTCVFGIPPSCDDGNPCTTDSCNSILGCQWTDNSDPCDDNDACTLNDMCTFGYCVGAFACRLYGDVEPLGSPGGDCDIDVDDILLVLDDFGGLVTPSGVGDIEPCDSDGDTDVDDILAVLDAFGGNSACGDPCPARYE